MHFIKTPYILLFFALLCVFLVNSVHAAVGDSTVSIMEDTSENGWTDASYNTSVRLVTSPVYSGKNALAATINDDGGLDFQSVNGVSTANLTTFHFALRASTTNQQYEVYADSSYGSPLTNPVSLNNFGGQPIATGWKVYDIPLSALGAGNVTLKDLVIHDAVGKNQAVLYVDQVQLLSNQTTTPAPTTTTRPSMQPTATLAPTRTPSITVTPTSIPTPTPTGTTGNVYMALGDSFAFGYHLAKYQQEIATNTYSAASFNDGYDANFYTNLLNKRLASQEVNYSCPGETTTTFINGGCAFHTSSSALHSSYPASQSQLQAALSYLRANAGKVSVITINIGTNDAINLANNCQTNANPTNCFNQRTAGVLSIARQNYTNIINQLQLVAPNARIILVKSPIPVSSPGSDTLVSGIGQIVDDLARTKVLRQADATSIFTPNTLCSLTNYCSQPQDFHPNAAGYNTMAQQIWSASGFIN